MEQKWTFRVLYEDNHLLVVEKPAGLLVQGDATGRTNLLDLAREDIKVRFDKPGRVFVGLVHRLDRQVAGVVVLARTSKAASRLSAQFRERQTRKIYWAVVHGCPEPAAGRCDHELARSGHLSVTSMGDEPAQAASLAYRTLENGPSTSLLEVELFTGRRHQIRAQLAALGHPLVGDRQYGSPWEPRREAIGLLAVSLTIRHPTRGGEMTFRIDPPPAWPWLPLA